MKKLCAYCDSAKKLTKEHIWPKCLINRLPKYDAKYLQSIDKVIGGELTIKDVCEECNNGSLAQLDDYICELYDRHFNDFVDVGQSISIKYDYNKLLRWLLKISYNSSRTTGQDESILRYYKDFILNGGENPENVSIMCELIPPTIEPNNIKIFPESVRCGKAKYGSEVDWVTLRMVSINSFYFYLILSKKTIDEIPKEEYIPFIMNFPGKFIDMNSTEIELKLSKKNDTYSIHHEHLISKEKQYDDFYKRIK